MKNQTFRMTLLFDFYGDMLTERQKEFYDRIRELLTEELAELSRDPDLLQKRYDRFRSLGKIHTECMM